MATVGIAARKPTSIAPKRCFVHRPNIPTLVVFYVAGGLVVGAVVGLLGRWTKHRFGAMLVGFLAAIPTVAMFYWTQPPDGMNTGEQAIALLITAGIGGPGFAWALWKAPRPTPPESADGDDAVVN